jgi:hypothetical protein
MPGEAAPHCGDGEEVTEVGLRCRDAVEQRVAGMEQGADHVLDVLAVVAFEVEADLMLLQDDVFGVLGEPDRVYDRPLALGTGHRRPGQVLVGELAGDAMTEVR